MREISHYVCGEAYDDGNCLGCGQPALQCPSVGGRQGLCHLEFMDYNDVVVHRATVKMTFDDVPAMLDMFTFPFAVGLYAVRIQQGRRVVLHRRKGTSRAYRVTTPVAVTL